MQPHKVVSREEWLEARKAHLKNEKALTRIRDLVSAERRALPWVKVEKEYVFDTAEGKKARSPSCSKATASCSSTTSCGDGTWARAAKAARSWSITSTAPTFILRITT